MDCEETGIVKLEDLNDKEIFVELKPTFHGLLENKIRDFGIEKFEREYAKYILI